MDIQTNEVDAFTSIIWLYINNYWKSMATPKEYDLNLSCHCDFQQENLSSFLAHLLFPLELKQAFSGSNQAGFINGTLRNLQQNRKSLQVRLVGYFTKYDRTTTIHVTETILSFGAKHLVLTNFEWNSFVVDVESSVSTMQSNQSPPRMFLKGTPESLLPRILPNCLGKQKKTVSIQQRFKKHALVRKSTPKGRCMWNKTKCRQYILIRDSDSASWLRIIIIAWGSLSKKLHTISKGGSPSTKVIETETTRFQSNGSWQRLQDFAKNLKWLEWLCAIMASLPCFSIDSGLLKCANIMTILTKAVMVMHHSTC